MLAVFLKEMCQFRRGYSQIILLAAAGVTLLWIAICSWYKWPTVSIVVAPAFMFALLAVCGESTSIWRRELQDPAFSPGVTTPIPPLAIAMGKVGALFTLLCGVSIVFSVLMVVAQLVQVNNVLIMFGVDPAFSKGFWFHFSELYRTSALNFLSVLLLLSTLPMMLSSLKERRKNNGLDAGSWFAVAIVAFVSISVYNEIKEVSYSFLINSLIFAIGALLLIAARVAPPASDRLMAFKVFLLLQTLLIDWLLHLISPEKFAAVEFAQVLIKLGLIFAVIAVFERVEQSRRVLNIRRPAWVSGVLFPVTTGALNSLVAGAVCFLIGMCMEKFQNITDPVAVLSLHFLFAAAVAVNLSRIRWKAYVWFTVILVLLIFVMMSVDDIAESGAIKGYFLLFGCCIAAGIGLLGKIYRKKINDSAA